MVPFEGRTIFLTLAGSQAHGTARGGSDIDVRGVCVVPLRQRLSLFASFEQYEGPFTGELAALANPMLQAHPGVGRAPHAPAECVVFDLAKFVRLCIAANPATLEILFADQRDWLLESPAWHRLYAERYAFLSKRVQQTFLGYALAQLRKIKNHRPGAPRAAIDRGPRKRNRARATLEERYGYDTKHAMHLIRLLRMGLELLERGELDVRRPDADELAAIRDGALSYEELLASAERLKEGMETAVGNSKLPDDVDRKRLDQLAIELMLEAGS